MFVGGTFVLLFYPYIFRYISIIAECIATASAIAMSNHIYQINGETYLQSRGLPMGNSLTGAIAIIACLAWDREFAALIENTAITRKLYKRYMDDQQGLYRALSKGSQWCKDTNQVIVVDPEQDTREPDARTMDVLREAANTISPYIQLTSDCPSQNASGHMPVLEVLDKREPSVLQAL